MSLISGFGLDEESIDIERPTDIFDFVKKNNIAVKVEHVPVIDAFRVTVSDKCGEMHIFLDSLVLDSKPDFRKRALDHCLEQFLTRRR